VFAHLGLHDRLGEEADTLAQDVDVTVGAHLAQGLEQADMLSSAIVVFSVSSVLTSNDARMMWWPHSFTAHPLLHQVWGHDRPGRK
jgi:hypothetical protein